MSDEYLVCYRDPELVIDLLCGNPDFDGQFDYVPYKEYNESGDQIFSNFMSGGYAFEQAVREFLKQKSKINC